MACAKMYESCISPQFRAIDPPNPSKRFIHENARLATVGSTQKSGDAPLLQRRTQNCMKHVSNAHASLRHTKLYHFETSLNVRRPRNDERRCEKCVFCYRFGRPATTIYETVARRSSKPQFWTSDDHNMMKGLLGRASKGSFCHSFGHPTTTNDEG